MSIFTKGRQAYFPTEPYLIIIQKVLLRSTPSPQIVYNWYNLISPQESILAYHQIICRIRFCKTFLEIADL